MSLPINRTYAQWACRALICALLAWPVVSAAVVVQVETALGPVRGRSEANGVIAFKGLRYVAPPTGHLRFRPPQPLRPWHQPVDAFEFAAAAIQPAGQPDMPADETHSEDCLFLNLWTQALDAAKRPVMVWLHGGAFSSGAPGRPTYHRHHFAEHGVVLVSLAHRLNVFGYTQLPDTWGVDYASSGLAGMLDIVEALKWIKANIERFGGDPDNVTIFGESGGGAKVSLLLAMPAAQGLFHKAIIQSGAALNAAPRAYAQALGDALLDELGIIPGDVEALAALSSDTIFKAQQAAMQRVEKLAIKDGFLVDGFVPSIDGVQLPRAPFVPDAADISRNIPLLIGTNKDENTLFLAGIPGFGEQSDADFEVAMHAFHPFHASRLITALRAAYPGYSPAHLISAAASMRMFWRDTLTLAERKHRQSGASVYMYLLTFETPINGGIFKSTHALDLSLVFGTYDDDDSIRRFVGPADNAARVSAQMQPAWIAFATTGNPNTPGTLPHWPVYDTAQRPVMVFDIDSYVEHDPYAELRKLMR